MQQSKATATRQVCTFYLEDQLYGVDAHKVQEVIRYQEMTEVPLTPDYIRGLINLRGQIVTAIDMRRRLQLPERSSDKRPMNVVVRGEEGAISLLVDRIGDVIEVSEESFETNPDTLQGPSRDLLEGTYKLADQLLLMLNTLDTARDKTCE